METVATLAYELALARGSRPATPPPMHSGNAYTSRLFRLLKMSGGNFVANPLVNIHLQGRFGTTSEASGHYPREGLQAGINVCFGHDDVFDPYPLGTGNMLQVLHMGLHVCQMMGYPGIDQRPEPDHLEHQRPPLAGDYGIETGNPANTVICLQRSGFEAVRCQVPVRWSIRQGGLPPRSWRRLDPDG